MKTIKILGAGPAGLAAAINLAKAGRRVEVYEAKDDVGFRFNGDFQGLENWSESSDVLDELKNERISFDFDYTSFKEFYLSDGKNEQKVISAKPAFYLVRRGSLPGSLDQALKNQALAAGVVINFNSRLSEADADIIATGPVMTNIFATASGVIFKTDSTNLAVGLIGERFAHLGYSYLMVAGGYGCIASVAFKKYDQLERGAEETKRYFLDKFGLRIEEEKKFAGVGSFSVKPTFKKGGQLYVGEAASLQDNLWGFGMRSAIKSGFLAAECLINGLDYETVAKKYFLKRLKASRVNRFFWEKLIVGRFKAGSQDIRLPAGKLKSFYNFNPLQRMTYPFLTNK